jgi:hypothetical protein
VAEGVVVALEAVEVEQHQQQRLGWAGVPQAAFQVQLELAAVADASQGVGQGVRDLLPASLKSRHLAAAASSGRQAAPRHVGDGLPTPPKPA